MSNLEQQASQSSMRDFRPSQEISLEEFLQLPFIEESPAWEFMNGFAIQKPMPKARHSQLQRRLIVALDAYSDRYMAFPELRCTFGGRSVVPDLAVFSLERIPVTKTGKLKDNITEAPDWSIEILSPQQTATRVIDNPLYCLRHESQLGWLIDPEDNSVLVLMPQQQSEVYRGDRSLPVLPGINTEFTPNLLFSWLQIRSR